MKNNYLLALGFALIAGTTLATTTPQALPFTVAYSAASVTVADDWSGVPGVQGFLGDDTATTTGNYGGGDPKTILTDFPSIDVIQDSTSASTSGGVHDLGALVPPAIGIQGSGTADAPYVVFYLNTTGFSNVNFTFTVQAVDADTAVQPISTQFRVGNSGTWTDLTATDADAFIADVSTTATTRVVSLPAAANSVPEVQVRIITINATGSDKMVAISGVSAAVAASVSDWSVM